MNLNDFDKRLIYGKEREIELYNYLKNKNINFIYNDVRKEVSIKDNKINGDFYIINYDAKAIRIDVKDSIKIFEDSILNFDKNGYYLISPSSLGNVENGYLITHRSVYNYYCLQKKDNKLYKKYNSNTCIYDYYIQISLETFLMKWKLVDNINNLFNLPIIKEEIKITNKIKQLFNDSFK